jgi:hypothetical protein
VDQQQSGAHFSLAKCRPCIIIESNVNESMAGNRELFFAFVFCPYSILRLSSLVLFFPSASCLFVCTLWNILCAVDSCELWFLPSCSSDFCDCVRRNDEETKNSIVRKKKQKTGWIEITRKKRTKTDGRSVKVSDVGWREENTLKTPARQRTHT